MSAFGHAGFGSSNRRNQLRAQGQIGGQDPYGNQVRNAMQPPTMTAYQAPAAYQQASGQQQASTQANKQPPAAPLSGGTSTNMSAYGGAQANTPGTAQPIQPQPLGTQYGVQAVTGGGYPIPTSTEAITGGGYPIPTSTEAITGGGYPIPTTLPTFGEDMHLPTFGDDMHTYDGPVSSPGMAQPIQPQSQGTPYGMQEDNWGAMTPDEKRQYVEERLDPRVTGHYREMAINSMTTDRRPDQSQFDTYRQTNDRREQLQNVWDQSLFRTPGVDINHGTNPFAASMGAANYGMFGNTPSMQYGPAYNMTGLSDDDVRYAAHLRNQNTLTSMPQHAQLRNMLSAPEGYSLPWDQPITNWEQARRANQMAEFLVSIDMGHLVPGATGNMPGHYRAPQFSPTQQ